MLDADAIRHIVEEAGRSLALRRAMLFGSRARGDARPDSDIDLAFWHDSSDACFADFVNRMADEAPTLLSLDLLDMRRVDPRLRQQVLREGIVVHG